MWRLCESVFRLLCCANVRHKAANRFHNYRHEVQQKITKHCTKAKTGEPMSFSQNVKEEILKNFKKVKGCCATSFLTAVLKSIGSLCVDSFGYCFSVESDNGALLEFCSSLAQSQFDVGSAIYEIRQTKDSSENVKYICKFDVELGQKLGLLYFDSARSVHIVEKPKLKLSEECCRRAFMQGLFLSCGSASVPESSEAFSESKHSNYHLELRIANADFATFVEEQFPERCFRKTERKNNTVLYVKDSAKIAEFLVFVNAINASFRVENIIIERSYRNAANRQRNCIDSNIDKAVSAGLKQIAAIEKIKKSGKFHALPQQLKDVAAVREENPDANLSEIAAILQISKSGVNHRLAKLCEIAADIDP